MLVSMPSDWVAAAKRSIDNEEKYKAALEVIVSMKGGLLMRTSHELSSRMWFVADDALNVKSKD